MDDAFKAKRFIYLNLRLGLLFAPTIKISGYVPAHLPFAVAMFRGLNLRVLPTAPEF